MFDTRSMADQISNKGVLIKFDEADLKPKFITDLSERRATFAENMGLYLFPKISRMSCDQF